MRVVLGKAALDVHVGDARLEKAERVMDLFEVKLGRGPLLADAITELIGKGWGHGGCGHDAWLCVAYLDGVQGMLLDKGVERVGPSAFSSLTYNTNAWGRSDCLVGTL